jgi:Fe-S oxidoreductase
MVSLTVLREQNEHTRFARQREDDSRTAIPTPAARALAAELRAKIKGEVRFDAGSRALYATGGSNYRQAPIGVVIPRTKDDVIETVAAARRFGAPVLSRGGGTSLGGQCCNVAVVMDFSKYMHHVLRIDPGRRLGTVQPGCVLDDLRGAATRHGLNFGPDPSTHNHCTLGGMLGNDSCGSHSLLCRNAGRGLRVADNTEELEVLTYDGLRLRVGATPPDELERFIAAGGPRGELYAKLKAFLELKRIWGPQWKMSPGKKVGAYGITENLRLGPDYNPPQPATHFHFPDDRHSFAWAALRCVGVGECRREPGQVMCPSYQVTREEKDCTRGRARLLWEMMNGEVLTDGWKSEAVKDSLDLCLACKGCKGDCPVNVDMATYKAEFLSHYYEGRLRPRYAYSMGWIYWWARLASLANSFSQTPGLSDFSKWLGGIAQERHMPAFARETFKDWYRRRSPRNHGKPPVILWADTFNNHLSPDVAQTAVEVLEDAGYQVWVPEKSLCCGRPLYDFGMLAEAERLLRQILTTLQPQIEAGIPVVGLEPSCLVGFRDELCNLFPNDRNAQRLKSQSFMLSEFLNKKVKDYRVPPLHRKALVHGHCHHKSVIGMGDEKELLGKLGLEWEEPDKGCCGMAGSFGFEAGHYDISMKIGEQRLLPAVRRADDDTLIIANGFSCHQQIAQGTGRTPLHLAQVLQMALRQARGELAEVAHNGRTHGIGAGTAALLGAGVLAGGLVGWQLARSRRQREEVQA